MGGGSLMTPVLVILFGVSPTVAIGTDIAHGAIFKTVGAVQHRRMGNVRAQLAGWMLLGIGADVARRRLAGQLDPGSLRRRRRVGDGAGTGWALAVRLRRPAREDVHRAKEVGDGDFALTSRDKIAAVLIGFFGGFIVGLTSVGSGVFFGLTLLVIFPLRAHKVVGTDIFHAAALLYVAGIGHWVAGNVDMSIVGWLLLGSIPGVLLGGHLTLSIPERPLRLLLAAVLGLAGLKLLDVPGAGIIIVVNARGRGDRAARLARPQQLDPLPAGPRSRLSAYGGSVTESDPGSGT